MKKYIVYDDEGKILKQIQCFQHEIEANVPEGYTYKEYSGDAINKQISNGKVVKADAPNNQGQHSFRLIRDRLLKASDWTQVPDSPLSESDKIAWRAYRQELRDLPQNYPENVPFEDVVFPNPPN